ncbi:3011_t:CDS:1, partial [Cetraspora pellucida]
SNTSYIDNSAEWAQIERPMEDSNTLQPQGSVEHMILDESSQDFTKAETLSADTYTEFPAKNQTSDSTSININAISKLDEAEFTLVTSRNKRNKGKKKDQDKTVSLSKNKKFSQWGSSKLGHPY